MAATWYWNHDAGAKIRSRRTGESDIFCRRWIGSHGMSTTDATKLPLAGGTMTGGIVFSGPSSDITSAGNEHIALMPGGTGNVGIGTTTPTTDLEVVGIVKATSFKGAARR